ncbi:hypothetical protein ScPMuIL_017051 [Solemya velum]
MARKNMLKSENSGSLHFDSRTKAVMAETPQDNVKEKVAAIRELVPGKSNNEIVLVLQYYDYDVEKSIQAYLEDGAKEALNQWHYPGNTKGPKKKRNKRKPTGPNSDTSQVNGDVSSSTKEPNLISNGDLNGERIDSPADIPIHNVKATVIRSPPGTSHQVHQNQHHHKHHPHQGHHQAPRSRTTSERSNSSIITDWGWDLTSNKKFHAGLEKSIKDLHRQTVSLDRLRLVLNDEVEKAYKRIKTVFDEVRSCLNDRENHLLQELEQVKIDGGETFKNRLEKARQLKLGIDRSEKMNEQEIAELRAEIKHFVSDRKIDDDLGRTTRFSYDSDFLEGEIKKFGEVPSVKCLYATRRPSVSSHASSGAADDHDASNSAALTMQSSKSAENGNEEEGDEFDDMPPEIAELQRKIKETMQIQLEQRQSTGHIDEDWRRSRRPPRGGRESVRGTRGAARGSYSRGGGSGSPQGNRGSPGSGRGRGRGRGGMRPDRDQKPRNTISSENQSDSQANRKPALTVAGPSD